MYQRWEKRGWEARFPFVPINQRAERWALTKKGQKPGFEDTKSVKVRAPLSLPPRSLKESTGPLLAYKP